MFPEIWFGKPVCGVGVKTVVGISVTQGLAMPQMAVLTLMRSFIGFIFKISYKSISLLLSVGLASRKLLAMVSAGFRVDVPCGLQASFRDGVPNGSRAAEMVWKTRACGKRVAGTYRHRHAHVVFQAKTKLKAAKNKKPCLAGWLQGLPMGGVQS